MTRERNTWLWIDDANMPGDALKRLRLLSKEARELYIASLWYTHRHGTNIIPRELVDNLTDRFYAEDTGHEWHRHRAPDVYEPPI